MPVAWPDNKAFAFTIIDDTDSARLADIQPIYDLLLDHGLRTTKTVWPLRSRPGTPLEGDTLEDQPHRRWILDLRDRGVEIALHGASAEPSERDRSERALDLFRDVIGHDPRVYASHSGQLEAMYWGGARLTGLARRTFELANRFLERDLAFHGEAETSPYFWGDLCRDRLEYSRNLTFNDINTLACDPLMPYHDPAKPYVRYWFSATNAAVGDSFVALLSDVNLERLAASGGACIAYTHFAYNFVDGGRVRRDFATQIARLARMGGWFVPVSGVLDHLRAQPGWTGRASRIGLERMQWRWMLDNVRTSRGKKYIARARRRILRR